MFHTAPKWFTPSQEGVTSHLPFIHAYLRQQRLNSEETKDWVEGLVWARTLASGERKDNSCTQKERREWATRRRRRQTAGRYGTGALQLHANWEEKHTFKRSLPAHVTKSSDCFLGFRCCIKVNSLETVEGNSIMVICSFIKLQKLHRSCAFIPSTM